ncbi:MAG: DNA primase [Lachnospiraceae bacterium]|nr:DNA primase [Lachnospiraceae bacterium]
MYYPDELVEEIRSRNDIVDVIGSYVHLQKKGSNHFGLCPFHNEKSGSFSVSAPKQMYHCFGCGASGNVITFIMKYENFTFPEAIKLLADRVSIKLPELEYSAEARKKDELKNSLLEVNKEAAKFYYYQLRDESGKIGLDYFKGRGLSDETIKNFGLGFARVGKNSMYSYLKNKGFSDDVLAKSGLFNIDEKRGALDKFWNRVIFPIMDVNHRVIGFGGRVMGDGKPKYLNSQDTPVFDKGRNLYGLNFARSSRKKQLIICEGYMDVIALHQAGFNQAVASLGTALTSGHASLLRRYTDEVLLTYDSDEAGISAALRAIPILKGVGLSAKVIDMRPFKDPDEFIKNLGAEEFQKRIENAENSFYYEIRMLERDYDLNDPESKTKFFNEVANKILRFEDELERDNYIESICNKYSINQESLKKLVGKQAMKNEGIKVYDRPKSGISSEKKDPNEGGRKTQRLLLSWICEDQNVYNMVKNYIDVSDFTEEIYRKAAELLFEQINNGELNEAKIIGCFTNEEEQTEVASLFNTPREETDEAEKSRSLKQLVIRLKQVSFDKKASETSDDADALMKMFENKKKLEELNKVSFEFKEV